MGGDGHDGFHIKAYYPLSIDHPTLALCKLLILFFSLVSCTKDKLKVAEYKIHTHPHPHHHYQNLQLEDELQIPTMIMIPILRYGEIVRRMSIFPFASDFWDSSCEVGEEDEGGDLYFSINVILLVVGCGHNTSYYK